MIKKYCDIDVNFPEIAWIGMIFVILKNNGNKKIPIIMRKLCKTKEEEMAYLNLKGEEIEKEMKKDMVYGTCLVKIKLKKLITNKEECWTKIDESKMVKPTFEQGLQEAVNIMCTPGLYDILAIGGVCDMDNDWTINAASIILKGKNDKELLEFMSGLGVDVNPRAKQSALYEVIKRIGINTESGVEMILKDDIVPNDANLA